MSVKTDASGRRWVQAEVEVPGTPEQVWEAIATGPGVSSWFVPTEERADGAVVSHFGPGMDAIATKTAWEPPHRFAAESAGFGENAPPLATEWIVEARSGGACVVRVVHSLFASGDDWDDQLESIESGWPAFFRILRMYLTRFRGQTCSTFRVMGVSVQPEARAWDALKNSLGLTHAREGEQWNTGVDAQRLAGLVEGTGEGKHLHELLILEEPAPGIVFLNACMMAEQTYLTMSFYLYGDRGTAAAAHAEPLWRDWMNEHFSSVAA